MSPGNQASWCSRCWSSRTLVPVSPSDSSDPGWVFAVSFAFVLGLAVGLSVGCAVALWLEVGLALGLDAVVVTAEGSAETPRRSTGSHAVRASTALATSTMSAFGLVACTACLLRSHIPGCQRQCGRRLPAGARGMPEANPAHPQFPTLGRAASKELWQATPKRHDFVNAAAAPTVQACTRLAMWIASSAPAGVTPYSSG